MDMHALISVQDSADDDSCTRYDIEIVGVYTSLSQAREAAVKLAGRELSWTRLDPKSWWADEGYLVKAVWVNT